MKSVWANSDPSQFSEDAIEFRPVPGRLVEVTEINAEGDTTEPFIAFGQPFKQEAPRL
jgi:hypothetical protein